MYPTKQQTGIELFQLVHEAAASFPRVALYFENSLLPPDLRLLSSAAAAVSRVSVSVERQWSRRAPGWVFRGKEPPKWTALLWPVADEATVWLPAGPHGVETTADRRSLHLLRVNADLKSARYVDSSKVEFTYQSQLPGFRDRGPGCPGARDRRRAGAGTRSHDTGPAQRTARRNRNVLSDFGGRLR